MRELQLRNRQRDRAIDIKLLKQLTQVLLQEELGLMRYELGVHFVSPKRMAEVNEEFLQHEGSTDVITFDYREGYDAESSGSDLSGEIYISVADAVKQAREFSTTWQEEVARYIVHGVLHLRGYDDLVPEKRKVMKREENRLVRRLQATFDLSRIAA
jgi:probable rRNA maturation factor